MIPCPTLQMDVQDLNVSAFPDFLVLGSATRSYCDMSWGGLVAPTAQAVGSYKWCPDLPPGLPHFAL